MSKVKPIISCSRHTDVPAFYMEKLNKMFRVQRKTVLHNGRVISLAPEDVGAIVFWSKDYGPFLEHYKKNEEFWKQYEIFFQFTIISDIGDAIERGLRTSLNERLEQLQNLCTIFGNERVMVRFDPIVTYLNEEGKQCNNLTHFLTIAEKCAECGIERITTKFCIAYGKAVRRFANNNFKLLSFSKKQKMKIVKQLSEICDSLDITLHTCASPDLEDISEIISQVPCIDGKKINKIIAPKLVTTRHGPTRAGCLCTSSYDIGSYDDVCRHNCMYCYANKNLT